MKMDVQVSAVLLLLIFGIHILESQKCPAMEKSGETLMNDKTFFGVIVRDNITPTSEKTYVTYVHYRGILLGGLSRLQNSTDSFRFTYTEDPNYGPYLESVNGLPGSQETHTYWQLLVNTTDKGLITPDVGIGCYIPNPHDQVILNYAKY